VFHCPRRFRVVVAGRRFGKTELALAEIMRIAEKPNQLIWYIGPTLDHAREIIWDRLKQVTRRLWAKSPNESKLRIELTNGSIIVVKGGFKPDNLRGSGVDFVVLDEAADLKAGAWNKSLRPALADRKGRALFLGTPKGRNHLFNYFEFEQTDPDEWASFQFTSEQGGIVEQSELASIGRNMDANSFRQEMQAEFTALGDYRVYSAFDRASNIRDVRFEVAAPLIWSIDFNVDPFSMLFLQRVHDTVNVLEEIIVRSNNATTEMACQLFAERVEPYYQQAARYVGVMPVHIYGDSSGNQHRTSSHTTDWNIIREHFSLFHRGSLQLSCFANQINPQVRDRINCVNARLRNAHGEPQLFIAPGCKELIRDLEEVCYKVDSTGAPTGEINKSDPKRTHMSDALGYYIANTFNLKGRNKLFI
jgi:hypothetical protein